MTKRENPLLENLKSGKPSIGLWINSPDMVELCGHMGFDYFLSDQMYTGIDWSKTESRESDRNREEERHRHRGQYELCLRHAGNREKNEKTVQRRRRYHPRAGRSFVVHPSLAAKSVQELIALARAKPGDLRYASGGSGSTPHLAAELFKAMAGLDIVHGSLQGRRTGNHEPDRR